MGFFFTGGGHILIHTLYTHTHPEVHTQQHAHFSLPSGQKIPALTETLHRAAVVSSTEQNKRVELTRAVIKDDDGERDTQTDWGLVGGDKR